MKKHLLIISAFAITLGFSSCKKETTKENDNDEIAAHAEDQSQFSGELDGILNETNLAIESNGSFSGRYQSLQDVICDATAVYDANSNPRTITITLSGSNCNGIRTRTGTIIVSMAQGVQWKNAGAAVSIAFQNVKITRLRDNKSVTINGTQTYTNVSGGLLANLPILNSITHRIQSNNLSLSFNDGTQRNWQVNKQRVFTYNNGAVITTTGLHTEGNITGVAEWGTNRFGNTFTTAITSPLIIRQDCSFRLTAGAVEHKTNLFTGTALFGLDAAGNTTTCPGIGAFYFKVTWTGPNGNSYTTILPY